MSQFTHSSNISAAVCDAILHKENAHREPIRENIGICEAAAPRFAKGGELEETLLSMVEYINDASVLSAEQIQSFLQESRNTVKQIAEVNVNNTRNVDVFLNAVRTMKQIETQNADNPAQMEQAAEDPGERFQSIYEKAQSEQAKMNLDMTQEKHYRDICEAMGEKVGTVKTNKNEDEEDEIEMVQNAASQTVMLQCPITRLDMTNPVKNKVCGHVYSREGILGHIQQCHRSRKSHCQCPYAGCANTRVTPEQLEDDLRTANLIKRELRRRDHSKEVQASQADNLVDSDGEE